MKTVIKAKQLMLFLGIFVTLGTIAFSVGSCKKKSSSSTDAPKTLTKSYLYDKEWFNQGNTVSHKFNSNGTYYTIGTWKWLNNSDSMEVKYTSGAPTEIWYFEWSTEHEFSAKPSKNSADMLFKDSKW